MEFLLILGCGVLLIILLQKTGNTATELKNLQRSLDVISDRLDRLLRSGPVAPTAPAQPAEAKVEIIRMPVVETPPPAPEPPPPPPAPEPVRLSLIHI